jgi:hypothetical protein
MISNEKKTFDLRKEIDDTVVREIGIYAYSIGGKSPTVSSFWNVTDTLPEDVVIATLEGGIEYLIEQKNLPESYYRLEYRKLETKMWWYPGERDKKGYDVKVLVHRTYLDKEEMSLIDRFELKARLCDYLFLLGARKEVLQALAHWKEDWPDKKVIEIIENTEEYKKYRAQFNH